MTIHFASSILKITKEGERILSSILEEGERLINGQTHDDVLANGITKGTHTEEIETETLTTDESKVNTAAGTATVTTEVPDEPGQEAPESENTDDAPSEGQVPSDPQSINDSTTDDDQKPNTSDEAPASTPAPEETPVSNENTNQPTNDEGAPVDPAQPAAPVDTTPAPTEDGPAVSATPTDESATNDENAQG